MYPKLRGLLPQSVHSPPRSSGETLALSWHRIYHHLDDLEGLWSQAWDCVELDTTFAYYGPRHNFQFLKGSDLVFLFPWQLSFRCCMQKLQEGLALAGLNSHLPTCFGLNCVLYPSLQVPIVEVLTPSISECCLIWGGTSAHHHTYLCDHGL